MSHTADELWDLLREASNMPFGTAQIALAETIMSEADAKRAGDLPFHARMIATTAYQYGGEPVRSFVTFSWCLAEFDRDPSRYQSAYPDLLWHFKYMVSNVQQFPEVPLERVRPILDDMARRWSDAGYGPHAIYAYRHHLAEHLGDLGAAQEWFDKWRATPRDDLSDCVGCDPSSQASWLSTVGRDEEAVALAEPVLAGRLTCSEQPQEMLTTLLVPYLRTGRLEQARDAHRQAYLRHRPNLADLSSIGEHIRFCARTGNHARALEIIERHLSWLDRAPSPYAGMMFAAGAALALDRAAGAGYADATIRRPAHQDRPAAAPRVDALAAELAAQARSIAARFDARNGTQRQGQLIEEIIAAEPLVDYLPLTATPSRRAVPTPRTPPTTPAPGADRVEPVEPVEPAEAATPSAGGPVPPTQRPAEVPETAGPDELLDLASTRYRAEDVTGAFAAWQAFDERYGPADLTVLQRARRADGSGVERANNNDPRAAVDLWRQAIEGYAQAGDERRRQRALGRLGQAHCQLGEAEVGLPLVRSSTEYALANDERDDQESALLRLAFTYRTLRRFPDALGALDQIGALYSAEAGEPRGARPVKLALTRARMLGEAGALEQSLAAAREARRLCADDDHLTLSTAAWMTASAALMLGDDEAALAAYDEVIAHAPIDQLRDDARRMRANLLAASSRATEAIDELVEWVARFTASGRDEDAAEARYHLMVAYLNAGRPVDAAEAGEDALAVLTGPPAMQVRHALAEAYRRLDQPGEVIACLEAIEADCVERGDQAAAGRFAEEIAVVLDQRDHDAAAARRFGAAADAYRAAGLRLDEVRARRRQCMSLMWAGDAGTAVDRLAEVDRLAAELPDGGAQGRSGAEGSSEAEGSSGAEGQGDPVAWERATLDYDAARVCNGAGRIDDALDRAARAIAAFGRLGAVLPREQVERLRGQILLDAGRPPEAERAAREAIMSSGDADHRQWMSGLLAAALDAQGRTDEARAVREGGPGQ
ncbi:hypothetical protein GCM10023322_40850 [Rugosimonospora acidiphila]|uniref:Tetratricopeptide repeat protein n=1 Tax=Rugosimonospora acidiphila TaxID=556531 RepID=A0ABP9RXZ5_9ACTN